MTPEIISFHIGYGDDRPKLHLEMMSIAEEQEFLNRFTDTADANGNKARKEYQICVDALKAKSKMPTRRIEVLEKVKAVKGEEDREELVKKDVPYFDDVKDPSEAIARIFEPYSITTERMAHTAINTYRVKMQPQVDFF